MINKREILKDIKLFVLDMDGTFYLGENIIDGSLAFIKKVKETGRRFLFFTNNSSKPPALYLDKLARMGCPVGRESIMTSGDVTIRYLHTHHGGKRVYLMGTDALRQSFAEGGICLTDDIQPEVVVAAFDTELTYGKLERACTYIRGGAEFLATHPDINCPTEGGFIPDCGAFCAAISLSTGKQPKYLGKPHREAVDAVLSAAGLQRDEIAFVGDRLYTDVAAGVNNGAKGLLVFSGETRPDDLAASDIRPDAAFTNLREITEYML